MTAPAVPVDTAAQPAATKAAPAAVPIAWLYTLVGLLAALHLSMVFGRSINWDEFFFYSQVEVLARGEYLQPLQTIHTRLFHWWLPAMPGSEVNHIVTARLFMFACLMVTSAGIVLAAERFADRRTALLALAAYLGAGFVLHHATSFRVDPMVTALLSTGLAIAARTRLGLPSILALGAVIGLAAMVTIKFVLWGPAFAGLALWRWQDEDWERLYPLRWIAAGAVGLVTFGALYWLHSAGLAQPDFADTSATSLGRSAEKMFGLFESPHLDVMLKGAAIALPFVIAAALVPYRALTMEAPWPRRAALIAIWFPLLTPVFYYNSYPYFFAFILPPVAVACAFSIPLFARRYGEALVAGVIALSALAVWFVDARGVTDKQRLLVETVHEIAPEPVAYFDCCGMIGSYPKANGFLTRWGVDTYTSSGKPLLLDAMEREPVPLLIDNNRWFMPALEDAAQSDLHPEDARAVRETYVRYWGNVYLAGRELAPGEAMTWRVLVPGIYTVRGEMRVGGQIRSAGDLVELERGEVMIENIGNTPAILVWGKNPPVPQAAPPENYWTAF